MNVAIVRGWFLPKYAGCYPYMQIIVVVMQIIVIVAAKNEGNMPKYRKIVSL
jgi:hypothetical protein